MARTISETPTDAPVSPSAPAPTSREVVDRSPGTAVVASDTGKGRTTIAESVVAKIASLAAKEVEGVDTLGGILSGAISGVVGRIRGDEHRTAGVGVEVGERQAAVDLSLTVRYPYPIHETAEAVRENVIDRIESMTGLDVIEVNIAITDLSFDTSPTSSGLTRVE